MTAYSSIASLKTALDATIKNNNNNEITGAVMNAALDNIADTVNYLFEKEYKIDNFPSSGTLPSLGRLYTTYLDQDPINTKTITLPSTQSANVPDVPSVVIHLMTGSTPNITIVSEDDDIVTFSEGFSLQPNTIYEVNALYNSYLYIWIVTATAITFPAEWEE